jgi:hypothetical protein
MTASAITVPPTSPAPVSLRPASLSPHVRPDGAACRVRGVTLDLGRSVMARSAD